MGREGRCIAFEGRVVLDGGLRGQFWYPGHIASGYMRKARMDMRAWVYIHATPFLKSIARLTVFVMVERRAAQARGSQE